jgi:FAD/FMN-containing dehydrogenase
LTTPSVRSFAAHLAACADAADPPPELVGRARAAFGADGFASLVAPRSPEGVAAVLAACTEENWPVVPVGGATWLSASGSNDQRRPPVLLSTARLDSVTEHEPADLVIGVQAGLTLERLEALLAAQNQWLPLDPPAAPEATIGAIAALSSAGPLIAGHGTPRDMALGVEIATGDGRLQRFGGRVVKNVAGYDGVRLAIGSRGRLGVITALFLRVRGAPKADRTLAIACGPGTDGAQRGADLALAVRDAATCDALELLGPAVATRISGRASGWTLLVRLLGSDAAVSDGLDRVRAVAGSFGGERAGLAEVPGTIWTVLTRLEAEATAAVRFTGRPTDLGRGLGHLTAHGRADDDDDPGDQWHVAAHAADGIIRAWLSEPLSAPSDGRAETSEPEHWMDGTDSWTMRYDRRPAGMPGPRSGESGTVPDGRSELTRRLRAVFDPAGILCGAEEQS